MPITTCPCGSVDYSHCCARFHRGALPESAEQLMRSRYSAYVLRLSDYVLATWHAATRPTVLDLDEASGVATKWLGLDVKRHQSDGDWATVEFIARYRVGGDPAQRLHEISRFQRIDARWYYLDGELVVQRK